MKKSDEQDIEFSNAGLFPSLVPDGDQYQVSFVRAERGYVCGDEKVFLHFKLQTPGPWFGETFFMSCKVARGGKWTPGSKFFTQWVLANGKQPMRHDRMSTKVFRNKIFRARFVTVKSTVDQKDRDQTLRYSVIKELLECLVS